jgi:hypothetical protein
VSRAIVVRDTLDWGCDRSLDDVATYETVLAEAIAEAFPGTSVEVSCEQRYGLLVIVTTRGEDGRIDASLPTSAEESEIEASVHEIRQSVWDEGRFWTGEAPSVEVAS